MMADDMAVYTELRELWGEYRNIWWNDADFAITLAYLLLRGKAASRCRDLMASLAVLRKIEVTETRTQVWDKGVAVGAGTFFCAGVLTICTGGMAAPVTGPVMAGSWTLGVSSIITGNTLKDGEVKRWKRRLMACAKLQRHFPCLRKLFA